MFDYLLMAIAAWWVAHLLIYHDGPYNIIVKARQLPYPIGGGNGALDCVECASVWCGALMVIVWFVAPVVVVALAVGGGSVIISRAVEAV